MISKEKRKKIIEYAKEGMKYADIERKLNVSTPTIIRIAGKKYTELTPEIEQKIMQLYDNGDNKRDIAENMNLSLANVNRVIGEGRGHAPKAQPPYSWTKDERRDKRRRNVAKNMKRDIPKHLMIA